MDGRGRLTVRTRAIRDEVEVEFEDEGPGVPEEILGRIFDPFFTTKPPGQGTGLGLAIAQGIVADHGGRPECAWRRPGGGAFCAGVAAGARGMGGCPPPAAIATASAPPPAIRAPLASRRHTGWGR